MSYIKSNEFVELVYEAEFNLTRIAELLTERYPSYDVRPERIRNRIANYRRKGLLPLDSGNSISLGELLKGTSTLKLGALTSNSYRIIPLIAGNSL